jgi:2-keto-4-pentenoate hydratase
MGNSSLECSIAMLACACMALCACTSPQQRVAAAVTQAHRLNDAVPLPHRIDETLTIESAYRVQTRIVNHELTGELRRAQPAGFKAGLTSAAAQARFRTSQPVAGVLFAAGRREPDATIRIADWPGLNIETEVALRAGTPIRERLENIAALRSRIDGIAPAIELPNLYYESPAEVTAIDIVASNVGSATYIVGNFVSPNLRDPNEASPTLVCDGKELNRGQARDALGDQWQAALWLVNTMIDQGWTIESGQILLTGALGRMIPATPARCSADYGTWGTIAFHIVP